MAVVTFDPTEFRTLYPRWADDVKYPDSMLTAAFDVAADMLGAGDNSPFPYDPAAGVYTRELILYRATCHILTLDGDMGDQPGRLASASEGSVSTSFDLIKANSFTGDWWAQTACGRAVWVMILPFVRGGRVYTTGGWHPWG